MEITLEKIELVKDRTGVSYKEAKEALEQTEGNVVDAIIYIEDNIDETFENQGASKLEEFRSFITESVRKGNVNRIKVWKGEELLLNLPLTAGVVALVLFRWWGIIAAALATGVTKCRIELVKEDGSVIDVTDKANDAFNTVKDKSSVLADELQDKTADLYVAAKNKGQDFYEVAKDKGSDIYNAAKDTANAFFGKKDDCCTEECADDACYTETCECESEPCSCCEEDNTADATCICTEEGTEE